MNVRAYFRSREGATQSHVRTGDASRRGDLPDDATSSNRSCGEELITDHLFAPWGRPRQTMGDATVRLRHPFGGRLGATGLTTVVGESKSPSRFGAMSSPQSATPATGRHGGFWREAALPPESPPPSKLAGRHFASRRRQWVVSGPDNEKTRSLSVARHDPSVDVTLAGWQSLMW